VAAATQRPWHSHPALAPFTFWDCGLGREAVPPGGGSYANAEEAELVTALACAFLAAAPGLGERHDGLAVVTPYRAQAALVRARLEAALGDRARLIDVNTIDGFQGREREVVIFSVVRSPRLSAAEEAAEARARAAGRRAPRRAGPARIGFVADERRMNVGLTRARASLAVVGSAEALRGDGHWGSLVQDALSRGRFVTPAAPYAHFIARLRETHAAGAPLQAPSEDEAEDGGAAWAPAAEEHVRLGDAEELSGDSEWERGGGEEEEEEEDPRLPWSGRAPPGRKRAAAEGGEGGAKRARRAAEEPAKAGGAIKWVRAPKAAAAAAPP